MAQPTSFRFSENIGSKLARISTKTGVRKVDLVEIALERFFEKYPTANAVIDVVIRDRKAKAGGG